MKARRAIATAAVGVAAALFAGSGAQAADNVVPDLVERAVEDAEAAIGWYR